MSHAPNGGRGACAAKHPAESSAAFAAELTGRSRAVGVLASAALLLVIAWTAAMVAGMFGAGPAATVWEPATTPGGMRSAPAVIGKLEPYVPRSSIQTLVPVAVVPAAPSAPSAAAHEAETPARLRAGGRRGGGGGERRRVGLKRVDRPRRSATQHDAPDARRPGSRPVGQPSPQPDPAPGKPRPAPRPKPAPGPDRPKPKPPPDRPKPAPQPDKPRPAPRPEKPKSAPKPGKGKPAAKAEVAEPARR